MPRLVDVAEGTASLLPYKVTGLVDANVAAKPRRARRRFRGIKLTAQERRDLVAMHGALLSLDRAAQLGEIARSTLKRHVSEGKYDGCVKPGKPVLFITDRFIQRLFQGEGR